jgi:hypothetical protein
MGHLIIQRLAFPVPFPLPPLPIVNVGKVGKREHSQKVPKREKWEALILLTYRGFKQL